MVYHQLITSYDHQTLQITLRRIPFRFRTSTNEGGK